MFTAKNLKANQQGFTLIELLVVVVLLGILSGIAVFAVGNARDNAVVQACRSQQAQLLKAMDLYYIDNSGKWATSTGAKGGPTSTYGAPSTDLVYSQAALKAALVPQYLKQLPPYTGDTGQEFVLTATIKVSSGGNPAYAQITSNLSGCNPMPTAP